MVLPASGRIPSEDGAHGRGFASQPRCHRCAWKTKSTCRRQANQTDPAVFGRVVQRSRVPSSFACCLGPGLMGTSGAPLFRGGWWINPLHPWHCVEPPAHWPPPVAHQRTVLAVNCLRVHRRCVEEEACAVSSHRARPVDSLWATRTVCGRTPRAVCGRAPRPARGDNTHTALPTCGPPRDGDGEFSSQSLACPCGGNVRTTYSVCRHCAGDL